MKQSNLKMNAILNMIRTVSNIVFPLITFPYVSRVLMAENNGKISIGSSFVSYFSLIASLGISTYAIRECSARRNSRTELEETASQIFSINVCTTIVAYLLMGISLAVFRKFDSYRVLILVQSSTILFALLGCDWLNSAMEDFTFITIRTLIFQVVSLVLMFLFVRRPEDYLKYAIITVLSTSGANIVNVFYRKKYCNIYFTNNMEFGRHFRPILLLFVMILAQTIFNSSDITMLGLMKGEFEVGIYTAAVKMTNLVAQVVASMAWVMMPRMALYFAQEDYEKINHMLKKALGVLLTIGLPCATGCICLSEEIILIMSGSEYIRAATTLSILMVSFMFSLIGGSFLGNMVLLPSKREGIYMVICCISTLVNLILNYLMIPIWGANAAAITTMLSSALIMIMLLFSRDRRIRLDYIVEVSRGPLLGCALIIVSCHFLKTVFPTLVFRTIACVSASILLYSVAQLLLKNEIVFSIISLVKEKLRKIIGKGLG